MSKTTEKAEGASPSLPPLDSAVRALYAAPLPSTRSGPLFNAFSYPTKISAEAVGLFIAVHTEPGAVVADVFSGSGTTGLAALLCERPTQSMRDTAARMGLAPKWGARTTHLFEISTLGSLIAEVMTAPPSPSEFQVAAKIYLNCLDERLGALYKTTDPHGDLGTIRHIIHSEVLICPSCGDEHALWDIAVQKAPAKFNATFRCPSCSAPHRLDACQRVIDSSVDIFGVVTKRRRHVPAEVHGVSKGRKWSRPATPADQIDAQERWRSVELPLTAPNKPIQWGALRRGGYHTGLDRLHHFYTPRNFVAMSTAMALTADWPEPIAKALRLLALSYNASHATLMSRIVAKSGQNDFALTGAQSGVLYVSGLPVEKNVLLGLERKAKVLRDAFEIAHGKSGKVTVWNRSSETLPLESNSVDYVFTDPPFGDYIPYAELNQINELWLEASTDRAAETIVSQSDGKDADHYQASMTRIFSEVSRVLKPEGLATIVFHSAHARIWRALTESLATSGLRVRAASFLDKVQASFKQVVSTISVKGDPLILVSKGEPQPQGRSGSEILQRRLTAARIDSATDLRPHYSRYAADCLAEGVLVELDAASFAARVQDPRRAV